MQLKFDKDEDVDVSIRQETVESALPFLLASVERGRVYDESDRC